MRVQYFMMALFVAHSPLNLSMYCGPSTQRTLRLRHVVRQVATMLQLQLLSTADIALVYFVMPQRCPRA